MLEVTHSREKGILENIQQKVQEVIEGILDILDTEYGADRNITIIIVLRVKIRILTKTTCFFK